MTKKTLWRRLNTAQLFLIGLLMVGVGLALWIEHARSAAGDRAAEASSGAAQIRYDLTLMSDGLRGLLLNPSSDHDKKRRRDAETDLAVNLDALQETFKDRLDLVKTLKNVRDFSLRTLSPFHTRVLDLLETDPAAALAQYNANYTGTNYNSIRAQRDTVISELNQQVLRVSNAESIRAQYVAVVGGTLILVVLVATIIVGRFQYTSVSGPLGQLIGAFERMRRGDFTQRVQMNRDDEFGVLSENL